MEIPVTGEPQATSFGEKKIKNNEKENVDQRAGKETKTEATKFRNKENSRLKRFFHRRDWSPICEFMRENK